MKLKAANPFRITSHSLCARYGVIDMAYGSLRAATVGTLDSPRSLHYGEMAWYESRMSISLTTRLREKLFEV